MAESSSWSRVLLEGTAIVASILLAFAIQAWWEGQQDSQLEREALATLRDELASIREGLDRAARAHRSIHAQAQHLLDAVASPTGRSSDSIADALVTIDGNLPIDVELATYSMLLSSGNIDILSNPELARHLWSLANALERLRSVQEGETAFLENHLGPYYDRHLDRGRELSPHIGIPLGDVRARGRVLRRLRWYEEHGIQVDGFRPFSVDYVRLLDDPEFSNLVHRRLNFLTSVTTNHERVLEAVQRVETSLGH